MQTTAFAINPNQIYSLHIRNLTTTQSIVIYLEPSFSLLQPLLYGKYLPIETLCMPLNRIESCIDSKFLNDTNLSTCSERDEKTDGMPKFLSHT